MSYPFKIFTCTKCDYKDTDRDIRGSFSYSTDSGLVPIVWHLGWCSHCSGIVPVEIFPSHNDIRSLELELLAVKCEVEKCVAELQQNRPWHHKLLHVNADSSKLVDKKSFIIWTQLKIDRLTLANKTLENRKSKPKCLICGSYGISPFPQMEWPDTPTQPIPLGVKHPACGGDLMVACSEIWVNMKMKVRTYDIEGHYIASESKNFSALIREKILLDLEREKEIRKNEKMARNHRKSNSADG